jgi:hypothetical protein
VTLADVLADHGERTTTLTVYAPDPVGEIADRLDAPGVEACWEHLPDDRSGGFATVTDDDGFRGSVPADAVRALATPEDLPEPGRATGVDWPLRKLLVLLREAPFSGYGRRPLLAASREFEDRAVRIGSGRLHAGFQRPGALAAQADLYAWMGTETGLDVHAYLEGTWDRPDLPGVTVHAGGSPELGDYWFVLFDGGPDPGSACGLLAEEREPGRYFGFWTYDVTTVDDAVAHLQDAY